MDINYNVFFSLNACLFVCNFYKKLLALNIYRKLPKIVDKIHAWMLHVQHNGVKLTMAG